ncbi:hypothetical protein BP6252_13674 [Coleophoma cylindrospora]|uniref:Uncharacterized protein n=1 Tax=Coleophoma cylindrospora TaxID=1849047 RepID=A0A3D8Q6X7_9HELO|nr:hypothetical protein BP6252_13674 [Coleophoma cylindrospora]
MDHFPRRITPRDTTLDAEWARRAVLLGDLQKGSKGKRNGCNSDASNNDDDDDDDGTCSQSIITSTTSTAKPTTTSAVKSICADDDDDDDDDDCTSASTTKHVKSTILSIPSGTPTALSAANLGISSVQATQGQNGTVAIIIILVVSIVFVLPAAILIVRKFWKRKQLATTEFKEEPSNSGQSLNQGAANAEIAESDVVVDTRLEMTQAREDPFADPKKVINNGVNVNAEENSSLARRTVLF